MLFFVSAGEPLCYWRIGVPNNIKRKLKYHKHGMYGEMSTPGTYLSWAFYMCCVGVSVPKIGGKHRNENPAITGLWPEIRNRLMCLTGKPSYEWRGAFSDYEICSGIQSGKAQCGGASTPANMSFGEMRAFLNRVRFFARRPVAP